MSVDGDFQMSRSQAVDFVNPFIGTEGTAHTHPGASVPFGMVCPGPDTDYRGWAHASGYQYGDKKVLGFSNTHISGAGIPEMGDLLLQPCFGETWNSETMDFGATLDKSSEQSKPGYYSVRLPDNGVRVELTATQRVAYQRYTFDHAGRVQVLVDFQHGLLFMANADERVTHADVTSNAADGEISGTVFSKNWAERQTSMVLRFSQPFCSIERLPVRGQEKAPRYLLYFDLPSNRQLLARVALSTVDVAGARANLHQVAMLDFDQVHWQAREVWNDLLGRLSIDAPERQKTIFYTALYHALLHPNDIADVDGRVRGATGEVIAGHEGRYYSTLSLWDSFRAQFSLLTLVVPERIDGVVNTLLQHEQAAGYLPLWAVWGQETGCMIGNPALPIISGAVAKGFKGFSIDRALQAMVNTSTAPRPGAPDHAHREWGTYLQHGYVPFDKVPSESVSQTAEIGVGDDAVARVARQIGETDIADRFAARAKGYRLLFDAETKMLRGRDSQGMWRTPFNPVTVTSPLRYPGDYTEGNAWQYTATPMMHDPHGMLSLIGDPAAYELWLDQLFATKGDGVDPYLGQEALIGQYAHGNEPSHHIVYLYAFTPSPWKGHARIREVVQRFYADTPGGIIGNDDCGQISAWYVFSTLGFYPVVPAGESFVVGAPQVRKAQLRLPGGKSLLILAPTLNEDRYHSMAVTLNGEPVQQNALHFQDLLKGGVLQFKMSTPPQC